MYSIKALTRESDSDYNVYTNANGPAVHAKCDWKPDEPVCNKATNLMKDGELRRSWRTHKLYFTCLQNTIS